MNDAAGAVEHFKEADMMSASFSPDVNQDIAPLVTPAEGRVCLLLHDDGDEVQLFIHIGAADAPAYFRKLAATVERAIAKANAEAAAVPLTIEDLSDLARPGPLAVTLPGAPGTHIDVIA